MDLMIESFPKLLNATSLTIQLTLLSLFFGIFVGAFFAILRTSKIKIFYYISYYYSYVFRGTPLLVQIFIIYFGLAQIEWIRESFLWIILKEPYSCAIIAFTLNTGAYTSEIFRSAFETVNKGILEAAEGLGLNKMYTFFKIKLPIAIKQSLPAYGNEMILMLKGTSLASTVTLLDLTGVAKHIISTTFRPVEVFVVAGSIYLLMTFLIHNLIKFLEKKYDYESLN
jgi:octopine/nopaline transport system permease protein